jgi:hypothetical protein
MTSIKELAHQFIDPLPVRGKPCDAVAPETVHGVREEEAFEKRESDDGLVDVELEMTLRSGERERRLVAENPRADHRQRLGLGRIDLARHDRGTRFVFRQDQFADAAAGTARGKPYIVRDLEEVCGDGTQRAVREEQSVMRSEGLEFVGAETNGSAVMAAIFAAKASAKPRLALSPVPTAVPPWASR